MKQFAGANRFAYNFYLAERKEVYENTGETLTGARFKQSFNVLKEHELFKWMKDMDKFALETGIEQVEEAFKCFFEKHNKFPRFKSKYTSRQSYTTKFTNNNIELDIENRKVKLPKIGWVKVRFSTKQLRSIQTETFERKIKSATVTLQSNGTVHIALTIEETIEIPPVIDWSEVDEGSVLGIDLGLSHFYIDSNGVKVENPRHLKKHIDRLKKEQRKLSRMVKGSSNYHKQQKKLAKYHMRIANCRKDFLHQMSRKLINENQVIALEDLNVKGMVKNARLAQSILDVGWSTFVVFLKYKAEWTNKKIVPVGRFFSSSKTCHVCDKKETGLTLSERTWVCGNCGTEHDRDHNAAINIKQEGLRLLGKI
jgi:putative transposase